MPLLTSLVVIRDLGGYSQTQFNDARPFTNVNQDFTLTTGDVTTITVPFFPNPGIRVVAFFHFTPGTDTYVLPAASPALTAASGTPRQTLATINPEVRGVTQGQTLQFLTEDSDVTVSIEYFALTPGN